MAPLEYQIDIFLTLECDYCDNQESFCLGNTKKEVAKYAKSQGWKWSGQNVICLECAKLAGVFEQEAKK